MSLARLLHLALVAPEAREAHSLERDQRTFEGLLEL
jgi:hypothetical protein